MEIRRAYGNSWVKPLYYWNQQGDFFIESYKNMKMITEKDRSFAIRKYFWLKTLISSVLVSLVLTQLSYHLNKVYKICLLSWLLSDFP